ncbi:MAG: hypothetical protein KDE54_07880, partial [Caldilineaceae bacterium]|nr:hypothetical protein [Caldilineaceae bacterium]
MMRFSLLRLGDAHYQLVWHSHHLLLDGWSMPILLKELFALYQDAQATLPPPHPYQEYITWLQRQDMAQVEQFWRKQLAGFTTPTSLALDNR